MITTDLTASGDSSAEEPHGASPSLRPDADSSAASFQDQIGRVQAGDEANPAPAEPVPSAQNADLFKDAVPASRIADAAIIGSGVAGHLVLGHLAVTRKEVPKEHRSNRDDPKGRMNFVMVGPKESWGGGLAYSKLGYSRDETLNVLPHQVAFKAEAPSPIDGEFLKQSVEIEERLRRHERPYQFAQPFRNEETSYHYPDPLAKKYSSPPPLSSGQFLRKDYGNYMEKTVRKAVGESRQVHSEKVHGIAVAMKHDAASEIFTVLVEREGNARPLAITARNVVLATGHRKLEPFPGLQGLDGAAGYHAGSDIYRFIDEVHSRPDRFRQQTGLIIGSGLTMNDAANLLFDHRVTDFQVVSRSGFTHELPHAVPRLPELIEPGNRIARLLDPRTMTWNGVDNASFAHNHLANFEKARELATSYVSSSSEPLIIRGQVFDRQLVCRALLSQYVAFRNEGMRGNELRNRFGASRASQLASESIKVVDEPNGNWITKVRVPTTDRNIRTNRALRDQGKMIQARVTDVVPEDGRLRVHLGNERSMLVDYVVDARGRSTTPSAPLSQHPDPLIRGLAADGLISPDPVANRGLHIDEDGRAVQAVGAHPIGRPPNLFPVSPELSKGDLMYPASRSRPPLSNTVAESVMGLQPLAKQASQSIMDELTGWEVPREEDLEYLYDLDGRDDVTREELDP